MTKSTRSVMAPKKPGPPFKPADEVLYRRHIFLNLPTWEKVDRNGYAWLRRVLAEAKEHGN